MGCRRGDGSRLPVAETAPPPYETGRPVGLAYDAATQRYYYVDFANRDLWAVDTLGTVAPGYPVTFEAYPGVAFGFGLDAHSTSEDARGSASRWGRTSPVRAASADRTAERFGGEPHRAERSRS